MKEEQVEELRRIFGAAPFIADLGIEAVSAGEGDCVARLDLQPRHLQQDGVVHAGVQATLADHTAGGAAATLAPPGHIVLTAEFKIHLLRPARGRMLECVAKVLKPGRIITVVESEVWCHSESERVLVSKAIATLAIVPKERVP
ncbi:MAG: PaaI family thioesterase [Acidobacteriota bacterium]